MTHTTNTHAEVLSGIYFKLFKNILVVSASDEALWKHRVSTFAKCGLLDFATPSNIKPRPVLDSFVESENGERVYMFRESEVEEPIWRRRLTRKLKAARPPKYHRHRLELDRNRVEDPDYVCDIAKVLTYKWVLSMHPGHLDMLAMKLVDQEALEHCLDRFALNQMCAARVTDYLMHREVNRILDENESFQNLMTTMKAELSVIREDFEARVKEIADQVRARSNIAMELILSEVHARCDKAIADIRERAAAGAAEEERYRLEDPISDEDPQVAFRRAVDKGLARKKTARKRLARMRRRTPLGFTWWVAKYAAIACAISLVAFNLEVNGGTLPELLESLWNWFSSPDNEHLFGENELDDSEDFADADVHFNADEELLAADGNRFADNDNYAEYSEELAAA